MYLRLGQSGKSVTYTNSQSQDNQLPECTTLNDAAQTHKTYSEETRKYDGKTWLLGCPMPCLQLQYRFTLSELHMNNWIDPRKMYPPEFVKEYYSISASFETMDIEKQEENLVYDSGSFFAAIGGNLGLFLGFSCFSIIVAAIDFIAKKFGKT